MKPDAATPVTSPAVRRFVRDTLGCGCPDEVLDRIDVFTRPDEALTELRVGGRLLVHVRPFPEVTGLDESLSRWLGAGVALRDRFGFNRFRLVLLTTDPEGQRNAAETRFQCLGADSKTHLHLIRPEDAGALGPAVPRLPA